MRKRRLTFGAAFALSAALWLGCGEATTPDNPNTGGNDSQDGGDEQPLLDPPVIANVAVEETTRTMAAVVWKTDVESTTQVEYGVTTNYGRRTAESLKLTTDHRAVIEKLDVATEYHFRILSSRGVGQTPVKSDDFTLKTAPPSFAEDVLTIFKVGCNVGVRCHGDVVGLSSLKLTSYDALMKGGNSGNPIAPGNATGSLLYKRVTGEIAPKMPLDNPALKDRDIELIAAWIDAGAKND